MICLLLDNFNQLPSIPSHGWLLLPIKTGTSQIKSQVLNPNRIHHSGRTFASAPSQCGHQPHSIRISQTKPRPGKRHLNIEHMFYLWYNKTVRDYILERYLHPHQAQLQHKFNPLPHISSPNLPLSMQNYLLLFIYNSTVLLWFVKIFQQTAALNNVLGFTPPTILSFL